MKSTDPFDPPIEIQNEKLPLVRFSTPQEALQWVQSEQRFYQEIMSRGTSEDGVLANAWSHINNSTFGPTIQQINNLNSNPNTDPYKNVLTDFARNYLSNRLVDSNSVTAQEVKKIAQKNPVLAARVLVVSTEVPFSFGNNNTAGSWLRATQLAHEIQRGWLSKKPSLIESLDTLRKEWDERFQKSEQQLSQREEALSSLSDALTAQLNEWKKNLAIYIEQSASSQTGAKEKVGQSIAECKSSIEDFKRAYNQALALRAPTHYWKSKQWGHRGAALFWFVAFTLAGIGAAWGVWKVWHFTVEIPFGSAHEAVGYTAFIPSIGAALLAIWFMRMFSRQVISNLALSAGASERVAMVKRYLALTEGGHAQDSDRGLILSSLFRSAAKTSDDAAPPTVADFATKMLRGEKV
jgi:hypothetical protein